MLKVKELKEDAMMDIKVNRSFYLMAKAASYTILQSMGIQEMKNGDEYFKKVMNEKYEDLDDTQRAFYNSFTC